MNRLKNDMKKAALPIVLLALLWYIPQIFFHHYCPMVLITGMPCPGCGLTRAFISLIKLDIASAIEYNPTIFLWIVFVLAAVYLRYVRGKSLKTLIVPLIVVYSVTIIVYIWRMKYMFPGKIPMVYEPDNLFAFLRRTYYNLTVL